MLLLDLKLLNYSQNYHFVLFKKIKNKNKNYKKKLFRASYLTYKVLSGMVCLV